MSIILKNDSHTILLKWDKWKSDHPEYWTKPGYKFVRKGRAKYVISTLSFFGSTPLPYFD